MGKIDGVLNPKVDTCRGIDMLIVLKTKEETQKRSCHLFIGNLFIYYIDPIAETRHFLHRVM